MRTHTQTFAALSVLMNNQRYFTSSVCRSALLQRWGTGGTRWHPPDIEQFVLPHRCCLREEGGRGRGGWGGGARQIVNNTFLRLHVWLTSQQDN